MRLSLNTATVREQWSLVECVEGCARNGFSGIAPWRQDIEKIGLKKAKKAIADAGLSVTGLCRGGLFAEPDWREHNQRAIEEAHTLGARCLVMLTGGMLAKERSLVGARERSEAALAELLPLARAAQVTLAIEPLHPMYAADRSFINTLEQANDLCDRLGEGMSVAVDAYHVWWDPNLEREIARAGARIVAFHICDWLYETKHMLTDRGMIGDGVIDLRRMHDLVRRAGFNGLSEVEIFSERWWREDPDKVLSLIAARSSWAV